MKTPVSSNYSLEPYSPAYVSGGWQTAVLALYEEKCVTALITGSVNYGAGSAVLLFYGSLKCERSFTRYWFC